MYRIILIAMSLVFYCNGSEKKDPLSLGFLDPSQLVLDCQAESDAWKQMIPVPLTCEAEYCYEIKRKKRFAKKPYSRSSTKDQETNTEPNASDATAIKQLRESAQGLLFLAANRRIAMERFQTEQLRLSALELKQSDSAQHTELLNSYIQLINNITKQLTIQPLEVNLCILNNLLPEPLRTRLLQASAAPQSLQSNSGLRSPVLLPLPTPLPEPAG